LERDRYDVAVIGAGFGGLGAALTAAEQGARTLVLESLNYPGGCASTFARDGYRFESGATLFSGFGPGQLFERWIRRHGLAVDVDFMDPVVRFRTPSWSLDVPPHRDAWLQRLMQLPGADPARLGRFARAQRAVADALWSVLDRPELLPPLDASALRAHLAQLPKYARLAPYVGRPLGRWFRRWGLDRAPAVRTYLDALCQITIQCGAAEAEAPFALATMDYYFRGTGHVRGGIGRLAWALVDAVRALGQPVCMAHRVRGLRRVPGGWQIEARRQTFFAERVIANLLPHDVERLAGSAAPGRLARHQRRVETGWGAAMVYFVADAPPDAGPGPAHVELVADPSAPPIAGNHLFCSISGAHDGDRAPRGQRTVTVSTHVPMTGDGPGADEVRAIHARMMQGLERLLPQWWSRRVHVLTASPRTFARFTGRHRGFVGGVPRRAGLDHYRDAWPRPFDEDLWLVGDSVFPGQSTLATALGGQRTATAALG
jgi:phytoene dehydrogenase-like protein